MPVEVELELEDGTVRESKTGRAFHRNPASDLWRNTLSQIPSVFGRLVYLASLRNQNDGAYEHQGLAMVFGDKEASRALQEAHENAFAEWLNYSLEQQKADLDLYLSSLSTNKRTIVETWLKLTPYHNLVPTIVMEMERDLYLADLRALLYLLRNEYGVSSPSPTS
jgi:hypothetical protein